MTQPTTRTETNRTEEFQDLIAQAPELSDLVKEILLVCLKNPNSVNETETASTGMT